MPHHQIQKEMQEAARSQESYLAFLDRACTEKIAFDMEQLSELLRVAGEFPRAVVVSGPDQGSTA